MLYLFIVFLAEVVGHVPNWVRILCAGKKTHTQKHLKDLSGNVGGDDMDDDIEMADIGMSSFGNPLRELENIKKEKEEAERRLSDAEQQNKVSQQQQANMMDQMKKLKQENSRNRVKSQRKGQRRPQPKTKKEMHQKRINNRHASESKTKKN
jgi:hypothetical protein